MFTFTFERLVAEPLYSRTGFAVTAAASGFQPLKGRMWAEGLVLENPMEFPAPGFLEIAALSAGIRWKPGAGGFNVAVAALDVTRVTGIRAADGRVNFARFREGLERRGEIVENRKGSPARSHRLKRLSVRFGTVEIVDHLGGEARHVSYPVGFHREWENIDVREAAGQLIAALGDSGLSREDSIFSSILPDRLWTELIGAGGG